MCGSKFGFFGGCFMLGLGLFLDAFSCPLFFDALPQKDSFGTFSVSVSLPIVKIGTDSMTLVLLKQVRDFVSHQLSVDQLICQLTASTAMLQFVHFRERIPGKSPRVKCNPLII
jgi:hypothetical protein